MHLRKAGAEVGDLLAPDAAVDRPDTDRCWVMANMVGAETVRREGYGPVRLAPERAVGRLRMGRTDAPPDSPLRSLSLCHVIAADGTIFLRYERHSDGH